MSSMNDTTLKKVFFCDTDEVVVEDTQMNPESFVHRRTVLGRTIQTMIFVNIAAYMFLVKIVIKKILDTIYKHKKVRYRFFLFGDESGLYKNQDSSWHTLCDFPTLHVDSIGRIKPKFGQIDELPDYHNPNND